MITFGRLSGSKGSDVERRGKAEPADCKSELLQSARTLRLELKLSAFRSPSSHVKPLHSTKSPAPHLPPATALNLSPSQPATCSPRPPQRAHSRQLKPVEPSIRRAVHPSSWRAGELAALHKLIVRRGHFALAGKLI